MNKDKLRVRSAALIIADDTYGKSEKVAKARNTLVAAKVAYDNAAKVFKDCHNNLVDSQQAYEKMLESFIDDKYKLTDEEWAECIENAKKTS